MANCSLDIIRVEAVSTVVADRHFSKEGLVSPHLVDMIKKTGKSLYFVLIMNSHGGCDVRMVENRQNRKDNLVPFKGGYLSLCERLKTGSPRFQK